VVTSFATVSSRSELDVALEALGRLVAYLRGWGTLGGALLALSGLLLLTVAYRLRRPTALFCGSAVGALGAMALRGVLPGWLSAESLPWFAAAVAGLGGALWPPLFPLLAGGLLGGLLGRLLGSYLSLGDSPTISVAAAACVLAVLFAVGAKRVAILLAVLFGGLALGAGLCALFPGRELAREVAARPMVLLGFAVVVGLSGAAYQLAGLSGRGNERSRKPKTPRLPRE
jgi:hypothetical protein